jgi:hypothetical protein
MDALQVLLTLFFVRLVLPIGLLLLIGEWVRNHRRLPLVRR